MLKSLKKHLSQQNIDMSIDILIELLTKNSTQAIKSEILKFFNVDMANSLYTNDRVTFVNFCHRLIKLTSRKYFNDTFLDSYLSLL